MADNNITPPEQKMTAVNVWLPEHIRDWAKDHFKKTRHGSLSAFVNAKISSERARLIVEHRKAEKRKSKKP